jgi:hypothetical protein
MTINKFELLSALTKEGYKVEYTDLAFSTEGELHQGVRIYLCKSGRNHLSFACGQTEVVHALFFEAIIQCNKAVPCSSVGQILEFMKKPTEESKDGTRTG